MLLAAAGLCLSCGGGADSGMDASETRQANEGRQLSNPTDTLVFLDGLQLFKQGEYDLAREQLLKSSESDNIYVKAESFLYLNALEMELERYDAARVYLEKYHAEAMKLYQKALEAENSILIHREEMELSVKRLAKMHNAFVIGTIAAAVLAAALFLVRLRRTRFAKTPAMPQESRPAPPHPDDYKRHLISAEIFKQNQVYAEITELARQKRSRDTKILNAARQGVLEEKLGEVFAEFISELKSTCTLTDNDVKLCCLSLLPLSTFAKSICFGSVEANIVKQRKHQIKKKMGDTREGAALFEFIFASRQDGRP